MASVAQIQLRFISIPGIDLVQTPLGELIDCEHVNVQADSACSFVVVPSSDIYY